MSLLPPGPHGGDAARLAAVLGTGVGEVLDLSASLNPVAPDCTELLRGGLEALGRYPDDTDATLALADAMGVEADRLVLTNGGAEAIALVAQRLSSGWAERFDFSLYRRHLGRLDPRGPRWRSDPHNPTGALLGAGERSAVRDEAFYLLATGRWTRGDERTTVVGSLTKAWALPGLRIGYVLAADDADAEALRALRPCWSLNGLAAATLPALLDRADPGVWCAAIDALRAQLVDLLRSHRFTPAPSDVNYVWIADAAGLREALLPHGVLLRDGTSFGYPDAVRIAVPGADGLERLAGALRRAGVEGPG